MNEHLRKSEAELNELLAEYWKLRHETGKSLQCMFNWFVALISSRDVYMETLANKLNMRVISE